MSVLPVIFEKADLKGERQPVQGSATLPDRGKLVFVEREEVLDTCSEPQSSAVGIAIIGVPGPKSLQ
ncbi:MAG: hypothetical protein WA184_08495, partial [Stellaceae bacterium]